MQCFEMNSTYLHFWLSNTCTLAFGNPARAVKHAGLSTDPATVKNISFTGKESALNFPKSPVEMFCE